MAFSMQQRLAKHLNATDGNLGRTGREVKSLSKMTGISVSMIQSVARGSRKFGDTCQDIMLRALYRAELAEKERNKVLGRRRG